MKALYAVLIALSVSGVAPCQEPSVTKTPPVKQRETKSENRKPAPFKWVNPLPKDHHPSLKHETFRSPSLGVDVGYVIMVPKGYENSKTRFPVVYYLHGGRPGSEAKSVRLAPIIYEAMESGKVAPAIYVFVNGGNRYHAFSCEEFQR